MSLRNHADGIASFFDTVLTGEIVNSRSLLAQLTLTPKSKRGLAAGDPLDGVDVAGGDRRARDMRRSHTENFAPPAAGKR